MSLENNHRKDITMSDYLSNREVELLNASLDANEEHRESIIEQLKNEVSEKTLAKKEMLQTAEDLLSDNRLTDAEKGEILEIKKSLVL